MAVWFSVLKRDCPFPIVYSWLLSCKLTIICMGLFLGIMLHWSMCCCLMPILYCFDCYSFVNTVWNQGIWYLQLRSSFSRLFWLFGVLCVSIQILELFWFHEKCNWNFDRDCTEYVDCFGNKDNLTILIVAIHDHGTSFHLSVFSISFLSVS